eukprot:COSAG02_NODE_19303_length_889_cov_1.607595_2_plen_115_part_00
MATKQEVGGLVGTGAGEEGVYIDGLLVESTHSDEYIYLLRGSVGALTERSGVTVGIPFYWGGGDLFRSGFATAAADQEAGSSEQVRFGRGCGFCCRVGASRPSRWSAHCACSAQ